MFFLGLLNSHLPYIVLSLAYVFYLGSYGLDRSGEILGLIGYQGDKVELVDTNLEANHDFEDSAPFYAFIESVKNQVLIRTVSTFRPPKDSCNFANSFSLYIFYRPPPFMC